MTHESMADPVEAFLAAVTLGDMSACDAWSQDVALDATVPSWRFTRRGVDAVRAEYSRWFADPARLTELHRMPTASGEVVEYVLSWEEHGVPHAGHHVHILGVDAGRIVTDTVMCGGRWPAALLAEMEQAEMEQAQRA